MADLKGTCIALAVQDSGNGYGWSMNTDLAAARAEALSRCAQYGRSCTIKNSFCDGADTPAEPSPTIVKATITPVVPPGPHGLSACQRFPNLC